jgi:hypothetical protein
MRVGVAWIVGGLLALGPAVIWGGASLLAARARSQAATVTREAGDQLAARRQEDAARATLAPLVARPGVVATLGAYARALPQDARLVSVEVGRDGVQRATVLAPDPDALRQALRRDAATRSLREAGQRTGDGGMIVSLEKAP